MHVLYGDVRVFTLSNGTIEGTCVPQLETFKTSLVFHRLIAKARLVGAGGLGLQTLRKERMIDLHVSIQEYTSLCKGLHMYVGDHVWVCDLRETVNPDGVACVIQSLRP